MVLSPMVASKYTFPLPSRPQTQSSLLVILTSCVKHKSFISNAYKKHGGWGTVDCQSRASHPARLPLHAGTPAIPFPSCVYFITRGYPGGGGLKQFPTTPRLLCKNRSAHAPGTSPGSLHLPRGVA